MAKVSRESIGELHDKLTVSLTKDDYYPPFQKSLKKYSKSANIPGFRKGKVPAGMIKKMYGQSVFADEVIRVANEELTNYLQKQKPDMFANPLPSEQQNLKLDMNKADEINIDFEIGLKPDFDIPALKEKGQLTLYSVEFTDEMVNEEIENQKKRAGTLENPEIVEEPSDMVYSNYAACDKDGQPLDEAGEPVEDVVTLENLPKDIGDAVKGEKAGFTYVFKPADVCKEEDLEAFMKSALKAETDKKDNYFKFTLDKVGRLKPAEMGEDFYKKLFPNDDIKSEEEFRKKFKEALREEGKRAGWEKFQNDAVETLIHNTDFNLPEDFLKNWMLHGGEEPKSEEEVAKELPNFLQQLRWTLISEKLITDWDITVSEEEIKTDVKGKVMSYFGNNDETQMPWMDGYLENMMKDEKTLEETHRRLLYDKLLSRFAQETQVQEETVDKDTFEDLPTAVSEAH